MGKFGLDVFTLKLAIGTIWLASIFMFTCGIYNIYPFVEELINSSTWGAVVAVPTIIFSYSIGAIVIYMSNTVLFKNEKNFGEIDDFLIASKEQNDFIIKRYESMIHQYEFFKTCIPTVIFLGISVIWTSIRLLKSSIYDGEKLIAVGLGLITILSSFIIAKIVSKQKKEINYFIDSLQ